MPRKQAGIRGIATQRRTGPAARATHATKRPDGFRGRDSIVEKATADG
jgi:hypothetical protein